MEGRRGGMFSWVCACVRMCAHTQNPRLCPAQLCVKQTAASIRRARGHAVAAAASKLPMGKGNRILYFHIIIFYNSFRM